MKLNLDKLFLVTTLILLFPINASANGGGPLLLFISGSVFIFGQIWILVSETYLYTKFVKLNVSTAFKQVFIVNLASTIIVGLGFPFLLAVITAFGMSLPDPYGDYMSLIGTWVYDTAPYIEYLPYFTVFWLIITFFLTVLCERWFLLRIWAKNNINSPINVNSLMWRVHLVSYTGLIIIILIMWGDFLGFTSET